MLFMKRIAKRSLTAEQLEALDANAPAPPAWGKRTEAHDHRDHNRAMKNEQSYIANLRKVYVARIEKAIVKAYSEKEVAFEELSEYLQLGDYDCGARVFILREVERESGKPLPGLINGKTGTEGE